MPAIGPCAPWIFLLDARGLAQEPPRFGASPRGAVTISPLRRSGQAMRATSGSWVAPLGSDKVWEDDLGWTGSEG